MGLSSAGSARKALIINPQLAIAWSGDFASARQVIARLRLVFGTEPASLKSLREELSFLDDISPHASCRIVGWLVDGERTCFRWDSRAAGTLDTAGEFLEGSGAAVFLAMANEPKVRSASDECSSEDRVEYALAARIAASLRRDWADSRTTLNAFGYWYEAILLGDDGRFRYVDSLLFSSWQVGFDSDGALTELRTPTIIVQSRSHERFAVVQTTWIDAQGRATDTYVDIVHDRTDALNDVDPSKQIISDEAHHLCWAFIVSLNGRYAEFTLVTERGGSFGRFIADEKIRLEFNRRELLDMVRPVLSGT